MQFSFFCSMAYLDPDFYVEEETWTTRRGKYDPAVGIRSAEIAFRMAEQAEKYGFDMVSVSEHHATATAQSPNPAVLAAALIQRVKRVRIGLMGPLVSISDPVRIAEEVAMLDLMSGGRVEALFLRGTPPEFLLYGANAKETRARTQEAIELIEHALSEPEPFGWEGRYYRRSTVSVWPGAMQTRLPIWSSGNSPDSVAFAAKHGHAIGISFYPEHLVAELAETYRQACAAEGWEPRTDQVLYRGFIAVAETMEAAADMTDRIYPKRKGEMRTIGNADLSGSAPAVIGTDADNKNTDADTPQRRGEGFGLGRMIFGGTPEVVVQQIKDFYAKTGIGMIDLGFNGGGLTAEEAERSLKLFGEEVLPHVKHLGVSTPTQKEYANV
jgi:alkanesulfonate monooxygenase SsuD/methylene tetrahydromethanopterin reductase-like flavin-dependent oxidoreductase (luciferase family)